MSKKNKRTSSTSIVIGILVVVAVIAYLGYYANSHERELKNITPTAQFSKYKKAPDFELKDANGKTVRLSDFKNKIIILDFWATWCPPCRAEIPGFVELYNKYKDKGVEIIGVSLDQGGWDDVIPFMKEFGVNYTIVLGNMDVAQKYGGIRGIPTTFVIDRQGRIRAKYVGYRPKEVFERDINLLLSEK